MHSVPFISMRYITISLDGTLRCGAAHLIIEPLVNGNHIVAIGFGMKIQP